MLSVLFLIAAVSAGIVALLAAGTNPGHGSGAFGAVGATAALVLLVLFFLLLALLSFVAGH